MKKLLILIAVILCSCLVFFIHQEMIGDFDTKIYQLMTSIQSPIWYFVQIWFSQFCHPITLLSMIIAMVWMTKNKKIGWLMLGNLGCAFGVSVLLKALFQRPRPEGIALILEYGYSMPSSHAFVAFAFYGFLFYLIYISKMSKYAKNLLGFLICLLIGWIGLSRIYLGVHYASDVFLGFCFGFLYLVIFTHIFKKHLQEVSEAIL